jgi:hypothetical protein
MAASTTAGTVKQPTQKEDEGGVARTEAIEERERERRRRRRTKEKKRGRRMVIGCERETSLFLSLSLHNSNAVAQTKGCAMFCSLG